MKTSKSAAATGPGAAAGTRVSINRQRCIVFIAITPLRDWKAGYPPARADGSKPKAECTLFGYRPSRKPLGKGEAIPGFCPLSDNPLAASRL